MAYKLILSLYLFLHVDTLLCFRLRCLLFHSFMLLDILLYLKFKPFLNILNFTNLFLKLFIPLILSRMLLFQLSFNNLLLFSKLMDFIRKFPIDWGWINGWVLSSLKLNLHLFRALKFVRIIQIIINYSFCLRSILYFTLTQAVMVIARLSFIHILPMTKHLRFLQNSCGRVAVIYKSSIFTVFIIHIIALLIVFHPSII